MMDLIVIGGGPGGYVAALYAAARGLKTVLVEKDTLGGTCLNRGCIPTKALVQSARLCEEISDAARFGLRVPPAEVDWDKVCIHKEIVVSKLVRGVGTLLKARKVEVIKGEALLTDRDQVRVRLTEGGERKLRGKHVILACGSVAAKPPIPGAELSEVVTSDGALSLREFPKRLTIVGGGVIGLEMAYVYRALGAEVTILEALPALLPQWDGSLRKETMKILKDKGIRLVTSARVLRFEKAEEGIRTVYSTGGKEEELSGDKVLLSVGRRPAAALTEGVALDMDERGFVRVDHSFATNIPGVYAVGDMNGISMLAHSAQHQAVTAVRAILGETTGSEAALAPSVIYMAPSAATIGLTEEEARAKYGDAVLVGSFPVSASGMATAAGETRGFVKVVSEAHYGEILGIHIVSMHAAELIAEAAVLMKCEGTLSELTETVHPHPSLSEMLMEAGYAAIGTPIHIP